MQLHTTLIASAQLHEKLRCARCRPWKQWITAASTKETKQFPRNELISTYSYRHGCPRYSLSHTVDVIDSPFFFSLLFNFSSITVLLCPPVSYREPTGPPPGWHERVFQPFQPCNVRTSNEIHPTFGETVSVEISIDVERFIGGFVMLGTIMSCTVLFGELALENSIYFRHLEREMFVPAFRGYFSGGMKIIIKTTYWISI